MNDSVRAANSGSREPDPSFTGSGPTGFDPGREPIRCDGCGHFIAYADIESGIARNEFTPLNEFGPEESAWVCPRCVEKESTQ